ncbi:UDP-glucose/GDP-mannose dehydrogenase family protein [Shimazuella sp. AN120528]|uniref:UDP-glucose dehydrogenase family protein n=1 Tax=Shimazuella soli TaxID=1892854 RepID=UPI001F1169BF|nr:UDP-glucose/GDP-mannose dehydrogenase family protein [Shimazuella soli]MCH5583813.1 UDP-glucose/GDP-mannose dehydrogenase family protein [Shimazuella soli]
MNVAVIGMGYVGATMSVALGLEGHHVLGIEIDAKKIRSFQSGNLPIYEEGMEENLRILLERKQIIFSNQISDIDQCDVVMVAVGTPSADDGKADLTYVKTVASQIGEQMKKPQMIVIKSTVPVGTGEMVRLIIEENQHKRGVVIPFEVISNPEFLREGRALQDALNPERVIIGCETTAAMKVMTELYQSAQDKLYFTSVKNSEMIKYASNAFLATKISFVNELARLTEKLGADIKEVTKGMGMDSRIGAQFLHAGIGYGGSCFPKDTEALLAMSRETGVNLTLLQAVKDINNSQVMWFLNKVETVLGKLEGKKIAVLGLTFKPNTDDIREAPSIRILQYLLQNNAELSAFDPKGMRAMQRIFPQVSYCKDPFEAIAQTDAVIVATEWPEIVKLDWEKAAHIVTKPLLFDGRNALSPKDMIHWEYYGVGVSLS